MNSWEKYVARTNVASGVPPNLYGYYLIDKADLNIYKKIDWTKLKSIISNGEFITTVNTKFNSNEDIKAIIKKYYPNAPIDAGKLLISMDISPITKIGVRETSLTKRFEECNDITLNIILYTNTTDQIGTKLSHVSFHSSEPKLMSNGECSPWPKDGTTLSAGTGGLHYVVHQLVDKRDLVIKSDFEPTIRFLPDITKVLPEFEFVTDTSIIKQYEENKVSMYSSGECSKIVSNYNTNLEGLRNANKRFQELSFDTNILPQIINEMNTLYNVPTTPEENRELYYLIVDFISTKNAKLISTFKEKNNEKMVGLLNLYIKNSNPQNNINTYLRTEQDIHARLLDFNEKIKSNNNYKQIISKGIDTNIEQKYNDCKKLTDQELMFIHNNYTPNADDGYIVHDYLYKCIADSLNSFIEKIKNEPMTAGKKRIIKKNKSTKRNKLSSKKKKSNKLRKSHKK